MFTANDICRLTGWSKGQLEQANSRIGFGEFIGRPENGKARIYGRGLAVMFEVAARLRSVGMDWKDVREILVGDTVLFESFLKDRTLFDENFEAARSGADSVFFVVFNGSNPPDGIKLMLPDATGKQLRGAFVFGRFGISFAEWMANPKTDTTAAVVVNVERVVRAVDLAVTIKNAVEPVKEG